MQTSKSYVGRSNNTEVKLELDDLEYVLSDGQNLIINPESATDDADGGNIVYADGSETVVLQSGGKHYIQMGGETYILGSESDNIQQLVINADDQSEESNSAIEYIENDEEGVVYKLAELESGIEGEPQTKRFKIGNTEYVTINDTNVLQVGDDNQFSVLNENSMSDSSNFQYAILSDGKLHFQLCDSENVEVLNEGSNDDKQNIDDIIELPDDEQEYIDITDKVEEYIDVTDKVQEYMLVNTNVTNQAGVKMRKIAAGEVITGKAVSLDDYLNRMQYKIGIDDMEDVEPKRKNRNRNYEQFLNKKLLIRKNSNGKSLFGKILHIKPAKRKIVEEKVVDNVIEAISDEPESSDNVTDLIDANVENCNLSTLPGDEQESETETVELVKNDVENAADISNPTLIEYNQNVTKEHVNFLTKTLYGLVDMPSLKRKLMDHGLEIIFVEQKLDEDNQEISKDVQYIAGHIDSEKTEFVLDNLIEQKKITSLTIIACSDPNNQRTTKVIFHEGTFKSMGLLNKRTQTYHIDKMLQCNFCHEKFSSNVLLREHKENSVHYFSCDKCKKKFTTQGNLYRHRHVHGNAIADDNPKRIQCIICKTGFSNVSSLSKHLTTHNHIKPYHCESCGKSFMTFGDLNVHRKVHNPSKTYYCDICGREFSRHSNLLRHTEIHKGEGDLYKCGICECSYKFISSLTRHIVQNHMKQNKID